MKARARLAEKQASEAEAILSTYRWFDLAETIHNEPRSITTTAGWCRKSSLRQLTAPDPDRLLRPLLAVYAETTHMASGKYLDGIPIITGRKIQSARKRLRMSVTELAQRLAISEASIYSWESGHRSPTPENLKKLDDLLYFLPEGSRFLWEGESRYFIDRTAPRSESPDAE